jgi:hypothetical protein
MKGIRFMPLARLLLTAFLLLAVCFAASPAFAEDTSFTIDCIEADVPTPVSVAFTPEEGQDLARLAVFEVVFSAAPGLGLSVIPAQYDAEAGRLWWMLSPGETGSRTFLVAELDEPTSPAFEWDVEEETQYYTLNEGNSPVLRYNFGDVPMPEGREPHHFGDGRPYGGPRSDYIHPLYGFEGEEITEDYPEHPHHRGVWWSWPIVRWGERTADIWAVCDVWARPSEMKRVEAGSVFALIEAENVWKFGVDEQHPIASETVVVRVFRSTVDAENNRQRLIDVDVELTEIEEEVALGGRPGGAYGGFSLRAMPAENQAMTPVVESPIDVEGRSARAWCDYAADFPGSANRTSFILLQNKENPGFPTEHLLYPNLNCFMPAFPGDREHSLVKDEPLVLKHRILLREGTASTESLENAWDAYNN